MITERAFESGQRDAARASVDAVAQAAQQAISSRTDGGPSFFFLTTRTASMDPELRADAERIMAENKRLAEESAEREVFNGSYHGRTYGTFGLQNQSLARTPEGWPATQDVRTQLDLGLEDTYQRVPKTSL